MRRILQLISSLMAAGLAKAVIAIIGGMAGNAAWDEFKDGTPILEHSGTVVCVAVFFVALALISNYKEPDDRPAASTAWWRGHERVWMFGLGLAVLAVYAGVYLFPATRQEKSHAAAAASPAVQPLSRQSGMAPSSRRAATPVERRTGQLFLTSHLAGKKHVTALAAQGDADAVEMFADALGTPLARNVLAPTFFSSQYFGRALAGESDLFSGHGVPPALDRIVVLKMEITHLQKADVPDAVRLSATMRIAVIDARSGLGVFKTRLTVDGMGFNEEFARSALKGNLEVSLVQLKDVLRAENRFKPPQEGEKE